MTVKGFMADAQGGYGIFIDYNAFIATWRARNLTRFVSQQDLVRDFPDLVVSDLDAYDERYFFSHRWESEDHPDPSGWQFSAIYAIGLEHVGSSSRACFWYDFASLPQEPRTDVEQREFFEAIQNVGRLCSECTVTPLVSSTGHGPIDDLKTSLKRGWLLYELLVASTLNQFWLPLFQSDPLDRIGPAKARRPQWDGIIPQVSKKLPFFEPDLVYEWFIANGIDCTKDLDLRQLSELFVRDVYGYHRCHTPVADDAHPFSPGETVTLASNEIVRYGINEHGLTGLIPDLYFEWEHSAGRGINSEYRLTPHHRPSVDQIRSKATLSLCEIKLLKIDRQTGLSPMYPGLVFQLDRAGSGYDLHIAFNTSLASLLETTLRAGDQ